MTDGHADVHTPWWTHPFDFPPPFSWKGPRAPISFFPSPVLFSVLYVGYNMVDAEIWDRKKENHFPHTPTLSYCLTRDCPVQYSGGVWIFPLILWAFVFIFQYFGRCIVSSSTKVTEYLKTYLSDFYTNIYLLLRRHFWWFFDYPRTMSIKYWVIIRDFDFADIIK